MRTIGKQTIHIVVDYNDLDKLFTDFYGHNVELVAAEEWNNYESHSFDVDGELDAWDNKSLIEFKLSGNSSVGITRLLLNDLVRNKEIQPGNYLVEVYW